jgi:hypothetical protein
MELAELPSRAGLEQENNNEENEARKATGAKKKGWFLDIRFWSSEKMGRPNARAGPSQTQRPSRTQRTRAEGVQAEEVPEAAEEESDEDEEEEGGAGMAMDVDNDDPRSVRI